MEDMWLSKYDELMATRGEQLNLVAGCSCKIGALLRVKYKMIE